MNEKKWYNILIEANYKTGNFVKLKEKKNKHINLKEIISQTIIFLKIKTSLIMLYYINQKYFKIIIFLFMYLN